MLQTNLSFFRTANEMRVDSVCKAHHSAQKNSLAKMWPPCIKAGMISMADADGQGFTAAIIKF